LTGSISHSDDVCVAVVAANSAFVGLGIDIELSIPLPAELHASIFDSSEIDVFGSAPREIDQAKLLFVVKESFFKLYHPLTDHFLDFTDVSVRLDLVRGTFTLELLEGSPALFGMRTFDGVWGRVDAYYFAFVALKC
jgi:4'-phosphopantetheinyl transferase EntD